MGDSDIPASGGIRVGKGVVIPADELVWKFSTSGGPGGQHANKASTRAELRFDIGASQAFNEHQRTRLIQNLGTQVRIVAGEERSQTRNRELAIQRLSLRLAEALRPPSRRVPTKPSKGSTQRRLDEKRRQSERKVERSRPAHEE